MTCSPRPESAGTPFHSPNGSERCLFSSVMALGALFGLMVSPCARSPLLSVFAVVGVPLFTFLIAAPTRLGAFAELRLFGRDVAAGILAGLCVLVGRKNDARTVVNVHRTDVEARYADLGSTLAADPLRLHHARRLAWLGAGLATIAGVGLPFIAADQYTFGGFPEAPLVFLTDVLFIGGAARLVSERMAIRLFEASVGLGNSGGVWAARARSVPLTTMLGTALGAVGGLVVLTAASVASGLETAAAFDASFLPATVWFLRSTAHMALPLGMGIGAIMGAGVGLAQVRRS
jgi:hypothetical protein